MISTKEIPRDGLVIIRKQIKIELQIKYMKKVWVGGEWGGDQTSCSWVEIITLAKREKWEQKQCMNKRWWKHGSFARVVRWKSVVWNTFR